MISKKIPSWIVPTSCLIIVCVTVLSFFILSVLPYKRTLSTAVTIYQTKNDFDKKDCMYGEIIVPDIYDLHLGDIANVKIESKEEKHYYQAYVDKINYNQDLDCYYVFVKFPVHDNINANLVFENPIQGDIEIIVENSNLLRYLWGYVKDIL